MIATDPGGFFAMLFAMTLAVYATRAGGFWLIGRACNACWRRCPAP